MHVIGDFGPSARKLLELMAGEGSSLGGFERSPSAVERSHRGSVRRPEYLAIVGRQSLQQPRRRSPEVRRQRTRHPHLHASLDSTSVVMTRLLGMVIGSAASAVQADGGRGGAPEESDGCRTERHLHKSHCPRILVHYTVSG